MDKELKEKVLKMFKYVATVNYSLDPATNYKQYQNVTNGYKIALNTSTNYDAIKIGLVKACELSPKYFPKPMEIANEIKAASQTLSRQKPQDNSNLEEGNKQTLARERCQREWVNKIGIVNTSDAERKWCELNGWSTKNASFKLYKMDLYSAINRQDERALNIINAYEKKDRETN